jgi:hypothetical protein
MYVRTTPILYLATSTFSNQFSFYIHRLPATASIVDARHPQTSSYSPLSQRSTRMSQPCSRSTTPIAALSPATATRAIGLPPIQRNRSKSRHLRRDEVVVRFAHSFLSTFTFFFSFTNGSAEIPCRFVSKLSKLRRFLSREDLRNRRRSEATTSHRIR